MIFPSVSCLHKAYLLIKRGNIILSFFRLFFLLFCDIILYILPPRAYSWDRFPTSINHADDFPLLTNTIDVFRWKKIIHGKAKLSSTYYKVSFIMSKKLHVWMIHFTMLSLHIFVWEYENLFYDTHRKNKATVYSI